jgi:tRNA nucleotidyltransferase/poly(A) polymerase
MKLSKIIKEAQEEVGKDVETAVGKMQKLTDQNHHTESLIELAKLLKSKKHENVLKAIQDITAEEKSLPYMVEKYRQEVARELTQMCRQKLNNKEFAAIYSAL